MRISLESIVNIDYSKVIESIRDYVEEGISESGVREVVLGLSGGLDSSVTLKLLVEILGAERVVALILPDSRVTPVEDVEDAVKLARETGVKYYLAYIDSIVDSYSVAPFYDPAHRLATGNLRARIRANLLYYYANKHRALVVGTSDRSEVLIGYFTKYGDGAADLYPIACLYKSQVRALGKILGVSEGILRKPSAPRLWRDHTAESELGLTYDIIDPVLYALFDLNYTLVEAAEATGVSIDIVEKILRMHRLSRHKRRGLKPPSLPWLQEPIKEI